jgi:hypothetical protein
VTVRHLKPEDLRRLHEELTWARNVHSNGREADRLMERLIETVQRNRA